MEVHVSVIMVIIRLKYVLYSIIMRFKIIFILVKGRECYNIVFT